MEESSTKPSRLLELPLELMHIVLNQSRKKELKRLRATNKFLNKLLTPILFESLNVYPHVRSFEYLIKAAENPQIGGCIRHLRYECGYVGVTGLALRRLESVYSKSISEDEKKETVAHARLLHSQALSADNVLDEMATMSYFERAFAALCGLQSIEFLDGYKGIDATLIDSKVPEFYEQLTRETCGKFEHTRLERGMIGCSVTRHTYARPMLMALRRLNNPLDALGLQRVRWEYLLHHSCLGRHTHFWEKTFQGLKILNLTTMDDALPNGLDMVKNLQILLKAAANLEELSITFSIADDTHFYGQEMRSEISGESCQSVFTPIGGDAPNGEAIRLCWSSNLHTLHLDGLTCTNSEIRCILKQHAKTLRRLELSNFVLMPDALPNRACLVSLLKWMRRHLHLEQIEFGGFLTNGGMQQWFVEIPPTSEPGIIDQVREYVLKGGPNPLEPVEVQAGYFDVHKKTYTSLIPAALVDGQYSGDYTLSMIYEEDLGTDDEDEDDDDDDEDFGDIDLDEEEDDDMDLFLAPTPYGFGHAPHPMHLLGGHDYDVDDGIGPVSGMGT